MHNLKKTSLLLLSMILAMPLRGQTPTSQGAADFERLRIEIESRTKGSLRAIGEAGRTGNPAFIPYLRKLLEEPEKLPYDRYSVDNALVMLGDDEAIQLLIREIESRTKISVRSVNNAGWSRNRKFLPTLKKLLERPSSLPYGRYRVDLALAVLGDRDSLQLFVCFARSRHPFLQTGALDDLKHIGGAFAIRVFEDVLERSDDKGWRARAEENLRRNPTYDDIILLPPTAIAIDSLSEMKSISTMLAGSRRTFARNVLTPTAQEIRFWRNWLKQNRSAWQNLEPIGKDVDFTARVCKFPQMASLLREYEADTPPSHVFGVGQVQ